MKIDDRIKIYRRVSGIFTASSVILLGSLCILTIFRLLTNMYSNSRETRTELPSEPHGYERNMTLLLSSCHTSASFFELENYKTEKSFVFDYVGPIELTRFSFYFLELLNDRSQMQNFFKSEYFPLLRVGNKISAIDHFNSYFLLNGESSVELASLLIRTDLNSDSFGKDIKYLLRKKLRYTDIELSKEKTLKFNKYFFFSFNMRTSFETVNYLDSNNEIDIKMMKTKEGVFAAYISNYVILIKKPPGVLDYHPSLKLLILSEEIVTIPLQKKACSYWLIPQNTEECYTPFSSKSNSKPEFDFFKNFDEFKKYKVFSREETLKNKQYTNPKPVPYYKIQHTIYFQAQKDDKNGIFVKIQNEYTLYGNTIGSKEGVGKAEKNPENFAQYEDSPEDNEKDVYYIYDLRLGQVLMIFQLQD